MCKDYVRQMNRIDNRKAQAANKLTLKGWLILTVLMIAVSCDFASIQF